MVMVATAQVVAPDDSDNNSLRRSLSYHKVDEESGLSRSRSFRNVVGHGSSSSNNNIYRSSSLGNLALANTMNANNSVNSLSKSTDITDADLQGRLRESSEFFAWMLLFLVAVLSIPLLWVTFWRLVVGGSSPEQTMALWGAVAVCSIYYRFTVCSKAPAIMRPILVYAERFICASMICTISANTAFTLHTPGDRLYDVGFALIPEQSITSPWRPLSDILTIALPFMMFGYVLVFKDRTSKVKVLVDWFRLVGISYLMRSVTLVMTSLPGPAPHCNPDNGEYEPPANYIDVLTKLGPLYGSFNTCGDLLFSGHAAWTTMTLLLCLRTTQDLRYPKVRYAAAVVYLLTMSCLAIAGRKHYTVDLVLAILIASMTFRQFEDSWQVPQGVPTSSGLRKPRSNSEVEEDGSRLEVV